MHYDSTNDHRNGFGNADLERANRVGPNIAVIFPIALIVFAPLPPMAYLTIVRRKLGRVPYERGSTSSDRMLSALFVVTLLSTAVMLVVGVALIRTTFNHL